MSHIPAEIEAVALLGWRVYPACRSSKAGCFKGATDAASSDLGQIEAWCQEYHSCNWRVVMEGSGIWGLDLDTPPGHAHDGIGAFNVLVKSHGHLPTRPMLRSGGGGLAIFFRDDGHPISGASGVPRPGIDPRRGRQSQTIPPSRHHATGQPYRWLVKPWEVSPPAAPAWLLGLLKPPPEPPWERRVVASGDIARKRLYRAAEAVMNAGQGERNAVLNRKAFYVGTLIGAGMLGEHEAVEALYGAARQAGLTHHEIKDTLRSGINAGRKQPAETIHG